MEQNNKRCARHGFRELIMKYFRNMMLLCIVITIFTACTKEPEVTKHESDTKTVLEVSKTELTFSNKAESKIVSITTTETWSAQTPVDWLLISPLNGNGTDAVTIFVTENYQNTTRESYVKICTKTDAKIVVVVQLGDTNNGGENGEENQQGNITIENGAIKAAFSVSPDKQIYFSQGNLQFSQISNIWSFAEHQWDYVGTQEPDEYGYHGGTIIGSDNWCYSDCYSTGMIDLFRWASSGYGTPKNTDNISGTKYDWGVYNKISNGGNKVNQWRTLTIYEWKYLISQRPYASSKYGVACVNNVNGLILLPDDWNMPNDMTFNSGVTNEKDADYKTMNDYSIEEWIKMEANGAVFLPAAGYQGASGNIERVTCRGVYWSGSVLESGGSLGLTFGDGYVNTSTSSYIDKRLRYSVRLVRDL